VGYGQDLTVREAAEIVAEVVGVRAALVFDTSKPDGTPRKLLDSSRLHGLGWAPRVDLRAGLAAVYHDYCSRVADPCSSSLF
jgi:GDP-L-fucose synthase